MKILVDENIPQAKEAFSKFGQVKLAHGRQITNEMLLDIDALIVRSITNVNEKLLHNTPVRFVGTATIGTDHIDKEYLKSKNIFFADAAGCNSFSVAEYVITAITNIFYTINKTFSGKRIGIVGYGNIGTKVARFAKALGFETIINDPPLERKYGKEKFGCLNDALDCDIITFHVPLNKIGIDKTYHLLNEENIHLIKSGSLLINTSRGPVVDNSVLRKKLLEKKDLNVVLDVWENEPNIDKELLQLTDIGTAHIAGYSLEGKLNGTFFVYEKLCKFLERNCEWTPDYPDIKESIIDINSSSEIEKILFEVTQKIYDITNDSSQLKLLTNEDVVNPDKYFDQLRKNYHIRREFNNYTIRTNEVNNKLKLLLQEMRFKVI
ncbi:MAG: 4-phosphoerythronate dehydrogenase [Melioribacter sp.]|nr:4-phosphoerythronate dehydrogenase [Melioribacter sp.]